MAQDMNEMHTPLSRNDQQEALTRRQQLVDILKQSGCLSTPAVEAAFRAVPRHLFLPGVPLDKVYVDEAFPTKYQDGLAIRFVWSVVTGCSDSRTPRPTTASS